VSVAHLTLPRYNHNNTEHLLMSPAISVSTSNTKGGREGPNVDTADTNP